MSNLIFVIDDCPRMTSHFLKKFARLLPLLGLLFTFWSGRAGATYRADYFDLKKKPQIKFDAKKKLWTLSNGEIERVIQLDEKNGSLKTLKFRNLKSGLELTSTLGSEAEISFAAPLREAPKPLTGWRATGVKPSSEWGKLDFDAKAWSETDYAHPETSGHEAWYRVEIPKDRMRMDRAYALVLIEPFGGGEVYIDGEKVFESEANSSRPLQLDLSPTARTIAIHNRTERTGFSGARLVGIAEQGTAPITLDLKQNWRYIVHTVNIGQDNSLILSLTLSGEKRYEGFELEVNYQIHAGGEPTLQKWISFLSHRPTRFLVDRVVLDRLKPSEPFAPQKPNRTLTAGGGGAVVLPGKRRQGIMASVLARTDETRTEGNDLLLQASPGIAVRPGTRVELPHAIVAPYRGSEATGKFLCQLYEGQYLARGKPELIPVTYVAEVGKGKLKDGKSVEAQIPLAAELGIQTFVAGDGWQTTLTGERGGYGDWVTDRQTYPEGLNLLSLKVREAKMNFGLWIAPNRVSTNSKAFADHPDWLVKEAGEVTKQASKRSGLDPAPIYSAYPQMCLPSGWMSSLSLSMAAFLRELSATTLLTGGDPFEEVCLQPGHEHPLLHAIPEQEEQWKLFTEKIHGVSDQMVILGDGLGLKVASQEVEGIHRKFGTELIRFSTPFTRLGSVDLQEDPKRVPGENETLDLFANNTFGEGAVPCLYGDLTRLSLKTRTELARWIAFYQKSRLWLAYGQEIRETDGLTQNLSLRPALEGRYGYLFLSRSTKPLPIIEVNASDFLVKLDMARLELVSVKTGKPLPFVKKENGFVLNDLPLAPDTWDLIEIQLKK